MRLAAELLLYLYVFVVGCCVGSFLNVLAYRVPRGIDFAKGRSFCPACSHALAAKDLVPLVSWLALKGRCRYCGAKISRRYPLMELVGGLMAVEGPLVFGWTFSALVSFLTGGILLCVGLIDADTQEIPDAFPIALAVVAVLSAVLTKDVPLLERGIGLVAVSVPMLLVNLIKHTSFGGGDVKLAAAAGLLLGWKLMLVAAFLALLGGGGYGIYLLSAKKRARTDHFAFGPFLGAGIYLALLFGSDLLGWYLSLCA